MIIAFLYASDGITQPQTAFLRNLSFIFVVLLLQMLCLVFSWLSKKTMIITLQVVVKVEEVDYFMPYLTLLVKFYILVDVLVLFVKDKQRLYKMDSHLQSSKGHFSF